MAAGKLDGNVTTLRPPGLGWGSTALVGRRPHDQAVERLRHLDLAGKPRARLHLEGAIELFLLLGGRRSDNGAPGVVDIDHAGRAGAGAAALRHDAGHTVAQRGLHHGRADLGLDLMHGAVMLDIGDGRHDQETPSFFCRLVDEVVYWNTRRLSGWT